MKNIKIITILCLLAMLPSMSFAQVNKTKINKNTSQLGIKYENDILSFFSRNKVTEKKNYGSRFTIPCTTIKEVTTYDGNVKRVGKTKYSGIAKIVENEEFSENCQNSQYGEVGLDFKSYSYRFDENKSPYTFTVTKYTEKNNTGKDVKILLESDNELERYASQMASRFDNTKQMFGNQIVSKTDFSYKVTRNVKKNTDMFETSKKTIDVSDNSIMSEEYNLYLFNSENDTFVQFIARNRDSEITLKDKRDMLNIAKSFEFK